MNGVQEISNRTHWTDPSTWVSNSSSNLLRGPLVRSHSKFDGWRWIAWFFHKNRFGRPLFWNLLSLPQCIAFSGWYCWWFRNPVSSPVEGTVVYPMIFKVSKTSIRWLGMGFLNHQQYHPRKLTWYTGKSPLLIGDTSSNGEPSTVCCKSRRPQTPRLRVRKRQALPQAGSILMKDSESICFCAVEFCGENLIDKGWYRLIYLVYYYLEVYTSIILYASKS